MTAPVAEFFPLRSTRHHSGRAFRDLADWLAHLRLKNRADRTLDDYERTIAALIEWRDKTVDEYTLEDLEHFVLLKYGATPGARVRMSHLKGFFDFLYARDRIPKNLGARLEMPKKSGQKVIDVFSEAELALIYSTGPLAVLLCETGIRKSEARNLQRRHIDMGAGDLIVYNGKGAKDRVVPLTVRAQQAIMEIDLGVTHGSALVAGLAGADYLWPTRPGGGQIVKRRDPISNTAMQKWWADPIAGVLARAGVPYRNMHVTRHTFATRLIRRGARIENVKQLMGHTSIQTTVDLYGHLDVEDARADLRLLEVEA